MKGEYTARVKSSYALFPRGYPWVFPVWCAIVGVIAGALVGFGSWRGPAVLVLMLAWGVGVAWVWAWQFARLTTPAFHVIRGGIRLGGLWRPSQRRAMTVPWSSIKRVTVSPDPDGAAVDIVLSSAAPDRASSLSAPALFAVTLIPGSNRWLKPPLLTPLANPLRYHVPLTGVGPAEVGSALRSRVPDSVTVTETAAAPRFG